MLVNIMVMDLMKKKKFSAVWIVVILMVLSTACTKPLMPPEIESSGDMSDSGFEDNGLANEQGFNGDDSQFASDPEPQDFAADNEYQNEPGVLMEEDLGALDMATGGNDLDLKDYEGNTPGNGSSGSFGSNGGTADSGTTGSGTTTKPNSDDFAKGVPPQVEQEDAEARLFSYRPTAELKDVHFEFDRYDLDERSRNVLSENASFLKEHPRVRVEIQGHCDERGTNNYNLALGQRRANSTKRFLKTLGIPETRMHVISYGEEKPFCAESNENCWWRNRRAHFLVAR
jgi:peptidoglycan-associated lipoprotein